MRPFFVLSRARSLLLLLSLITVSCASTPPATPTATASPGAVVQAAAGNADTPATATTLIQPTAASVASPTKVTTPTPTPLPVVAANTTTAQLTRIDIPPIKGKTINADHLVIDPDAHLLYIADRTDSGVDVFDVSGPTAKYVRTVTLGANPNGIVVAKNLNRVYVGVSDSTVAVIDADPASPKVGTVIARIGTGGKARADDLEYYPDRKKLYAVNGDDGFITVIDATTNEIVGKIDTQGTVGEQLRYNPGDGMLYLVLSDDNLVERIDPKTDQLVTRTDVGQPCEPHGLAINPASGQALLGCGNRDGQHTLLWDLRTGKVIEEFTQVGAGDGALYDAAADRYLFAALNFERGPSVGIFGGWPVHFLTNVPVGPGVRDAAYDAAHRLVYVVDGNPGEGALFSFPLP